MPWPSHFLLSASQVAILDALVEPGPDQAADVSAPPPPPASSTSSPAWTGAGNSFSTGGADAAGAAERLKQAAKLRREGDAEFFLSQSVSSAKQRYEQALELLDHRKLGDCHNDLLARAGALRIPLLLNLALCCLKAEPVEAHRALECCAEALDSEPQNPTALYRKAKALVELGDLQEAEREMVRACRLLPKDAVMRRDLELLRQRQRELVKVTLERENRGKILGARIIGTETNEFGLMIVRIREGGPLSEWNAHNPSMKVAPGDSIVMANGLTAAWSIMDEFARATTVEMVVRRAPAETRARGLLTQCAGITDWELRNTAFLLERTVRAGDACVDRCAICLEDVEVDDRVAGLQCRHGFHPGCILKWMGRPGASGCPLCRGDVR